MVFFWLSSRQSYFSVLQQLGEVGESEMTSLKTQLDVVPTDSWSYRFIFNFFKQLMKG